MDEPNQGRQDRPWQIIAVGFGMHDALTPAATRDLARIFDLCPELPMLTISTASGEGFTVSRDFPSDAFLDVDAILARIFRENPAIAAITFAAEGDRPAHTATPDEPFQSPGTKEIITGLGRSTRRRREDTGPSNSSP